MEIILSGNDDRGNEEISLKTIKGDESSLYISIKEQVTSVDVKRVESLMGMLQADAHYQAEKNFGKRKLPIMIKLPSNKDQRPKQFCLYSPGGKSNTLVVGIEEEEISLDRGQFLAAIKELIIEIEVPVFKRIFTD